MARQSMAVLDRLERTFELDLSGSAHQKSLAERCSDGPIGTFYAGNRFFDAQDGYDNWHQLKSVLLGHSPQPAKMPHTHSYRTHIAKLALGVGDLMRSTHRQTLRGLRPRWLRRSLYKWNHFAASRNFRNESD